MVVRAKMASCYRVEIRLKGLDKLYEGGTLKAQLHKSKVYNSQF